MGNYVCGIGMSDIVERLRGRIGPLMYQHDNGIDLTLEAADLIERLRACRDMLLQKGSDLKDENERLRAEREQLRDALRYLKSRLLIHAGFCGALIDDST